MPHGTAGANIGRAQETSGEETDRGDDDVPGQRRREHARRWARVVLWLRLMGEQFAGMRCARYVLGHDAAEALHGATVTRRGAGDGG